MSQYRVCERCRRPIGDTIKHRGAWQQAGGIGGSLGGSMVGSALMAPLGFVGSIAGAVGGAVAGSRAGSAASSASCNAVDSVQAGTVCEDCKAAANTRSAGYQNFGGGRLGDGSGAPGPAPSDEPTFGNRVSQAASSAGETLGGAAAATGTAVTGAASWVKESVSSKFGRGDGNDQKPGGGNFQAFSGGGHTLGSTHAAAPAAPSPDAAAQWSGVDAAAQERRRQQAAAAAARIARLQEAAPQSGAAAAPTAPQASSEPELCKMSLAQLKRHAKARGIPVDKIEAVDESDSPKEALIELLQTPQVEDDAAIAKRLQEEFDRETAQGR